MALPTKALRAQRAAEWRTVARCWAIEGNQEISDLCHEVADIFEMPLWSFIFAAGSYGYAAQRKVMTMVERELCRRRE